MKGGAPYTTASIEHYFASMDRLNFDPEKDFEPVPEPDITHTPRQNKPLKNTNTEKVDNSSQRFEASSSPSRDCYEDGTGEHAASKTATRTAAKVDTTETNRQSSGQQKSVKNEGGLSQREKWEQFKLDNDKRKLLNDLLVSEASDGDDLFTKVTSMVTDMDETTTARLKTLGIDFSFLKLNVDRNEQISDEDSDVVSPHSRNPHESGRSQTDASVQPKNTAEKCKVKDEVEMLFEMSPTDAHRYLVASVGIKTLAPAPSGEPSMSQSAAVAIHQKIDAASDKSTVSTSSTSTVQVKVCPECAEVNKTFVTWCVECGAVLSGVDPVPCKPKRETSRHLGNQSSNGLSKSATNFKNRLEESMNNAQTGPAAAWKEDRNTQTYENKSSLPKRGEGVIIENKDLLSVKQERGVRDSDEFEYETDDSPARSLPKALQSELSLDLELKKDKNHKGNKKNMAEDDLAKLSEDIVFVYNEVQIPKKLLPVDLQEELNLNLSLDGSQLATSLKGAIANNNAGQKSASRQFTGDLPEGSNGIAIPVELEANVGNGDQVDKALVPLEGDQLQDSVAGSGSEEELQLDDVPSDNGEEDSVDRIVYDKFINHLRTDPRLKTEKRDRPQSAMPLPSRSAGPPKHRPQSAKSAMSKVRATLDGQGYRRKWEHSSTTGWGSLSHGEVRQRSSVHVSADGDRPSSVAQRGRPSSVSQRGRPSSSLRRSATRDPSSDTHPKPSRSRGRPQSAGPRSRSVTIYIVLYLKILMLLVVLDISLRGCHTPLPLIFAGLGIFH